MTNVEVGNQKRSLSPQISLKNKKTVDLTQQTSNPKAKELGGTQKSISDLII